MRQPTPHPHTGRYERNDLACRMHAIMCTPFLAGAKQSVAPYNAARATWRHKRAPSAKRCHRQQHTLIVLALRPSVSAQCFYELTGRPSAPCAHCAAMCAPADKVAQVLKHVLRPRLAHRPWHACTGVQPCAVVGRGSSAVCTTYGCGRCRRSVGWQRAHRARHPSGTLRAVTGRFAPSPRQSDHRHPRAGSHRCLHPHRASRQGMARA
mmetsp:Transcript_28631/g.78221  ORF Transcript_28631/g.78221 Transcript_28631/m.78221 type:complete len:209 (+) Transcript_28631:294-920(+)